VSNFTGEGPFLEHQECLAAAPRIYAQLVPITSKYSKFAGAEEKRAASSAAKTLSLSRQAPDAPL
jgi:myo-inositol-1(or 4)-monophosphatase